MPAHDPERKRALARQRKRRLAQARIEAGLCTRCGSAAPVEGGRTCEVCRTERRAADRARAARRRAAGIRRVRDPDVRRAEYRRARQRAEARVAAGACTKCGRHPHEPGRRLCTTCGRKRRAAERARYRKARTANLKYGGKDPRTKRRNARLRSRQLQRTRRQSCLCIRCGRNAPVEGGASCEICLEKRRAADRQAYAARRAAGECARCGVKTFEGAALCGPCTVIDVQRQPARNAAARRRYAERRARQRCTHCGQAPTFGASRCEPCAKRAWERSEHVRGLPVYPPGFTVIGLATGEPLGTWDAWEDVVLFLSFERLSFDEVEILTEHAPMRPVLTGLS